ncbi:pneumococcal-type histidine triad protein [uncultured Granulicatella sp.]|uniref:pneumococcal-type histidine triad protein n=1 Tax=uncultured Granulicatella sp. TaxID=316089 RepID=UPI0028D58DFB|nr:pneumococcal-type histidine triad protein [uncultured Granulicatella sp.]
MKIHKKSLLIGSASLVLLGGCSLFNNQNTSQQTESETTTTEISKTDLAKFEKIAEEVKENKPKTIVGEVFENGYLKKHGDHYHFVYGAPPEDAIYEQKTSATAISSADDGYVFNPNDIVEENEMGYVVRHGDHFHFIYKNNTQQTLATTMATNPVAHEHHEEVEDGYVFDKKDVVSETETGYIVRHGDHFHYIYKDKEGNPVVTAEHHDHESEHHNHEGEKHEHEGEHDDHDHDGYVFDKKDIVSETAEGYVVRHGDHFHFIYKNQVNSESTHPDTVASMIGKVEKVEKELHGLTGESTTKPTTPETKPNTEAPTTQPKEKQFAGIHYRTSDGFLFDGNHIIGTSGENLLVAHNGNMKDIHVIPFEQLVHTKWEHLISKEHIEEAKARYNGTAIPPKEEHHHDDAMKPVEMSELDKKIEEKIAGIMKQYGVKRESIVVNKEKNAIIYPHGDHHHADPIDEHKPVGIGHSHSNYELFKPEEGVAKKEGNKVYTGEELASVVKLLKNSTFNNQNFTLANGQKRVSFSFPPELEKKLGTNMMVKLTTPDGKVIEKLSGKVFGEGVGNIANFELDKPYLPGETFKYTITSKDYPEVNYEGQFTIPSSLAYNMASRTIFYPFHAGDTYLRVKPQYVIPKGTEALVRVFDEFHGNAYLENNYKVGEIQLPIPKLNQGTTMTAGNKIPVTFMANAYLDNQSSYIVEVPILEKNNQTEKPGVLSQFKGHETEETSKPVEKGKESPKEMGKGEESSKPTGKEEAPKPVEKVEENSTPTGEGLKPESETPTGNPISDPMLEEAPAVDPVQEKVAKFAESHGMKLENVLFNMDGTIELHLPSGEVVKKNMADFTGEVPNGNGENKVPEHVAPTPDKVETKPTENKPAASLPEAPKPSEKPVKPENSTDNGMLNPTGTDPMLEPGLEEAPAVDPVQEKIAKFAARYGLGLDSVIFNMDGTIELRLPSGEVVKKNMAEFTV